MKKWFEVIVNKAKNIGQICIYGEIEDFKWFDEDVTPTSIKDEVDKLKNVDEVEIYVNSGGGGVFAGVAIYNTIKRIKVPTTAFVDGLAASIASLIVLAADKVVMPFNSVLMIHNVQTCACGEASEFRAIADRMDKLQDGVIVSTYKEKTGLSEDKLREMMNVETWLTGEEAVELGFADETAEDVKIAACYSGENIKFKDIEMDLSRFKNFSKDKFTEHTPKPKTMSLEQRHRHSMNMLSANT